MRLFARSLLAACFASAWSVSVSAQFLEEPPKKPQASKEPLDPKKAIQRVEGDRYKCGIIEFDQKTREIRIPCKVNMHEGPLEYALVHESGKTHESLLSTAARPLELNIVLLLLNWRKSDAFFDFSKPDQGGVPVKNAKNPPASQVEVHVAWKDKEGKDQSGRIEQWMRQIEKRAKVTEVPWIYTGSVILPDGRWLAEESGSIMALYVDPGSMFNNPREGNELDDVWIADAGVPVKETPVTVILKPVAVPAAEMKEPEKPAPAPKTKPSPKSKPVPRKKS